MAYPHRRTEPVDAADSPSSTLAREVKALAAAGDAAGARERFGDLIVLNQARANRIAFAYLRDAADADEAVQDAFVRVYMHIADYRGDLPFGQWFTRILINVCIDRGRARRRRRAKVGPLLPAHADRLATDTVPLDRQLAGREWRGAVARAVQALPDRQRAVFALCHYRDHSSAEVASLLGLRESTVRVHLFRAVHKLRTTLEAWRERP
jgi:RNA polymerase sigma-70 factor (ECF subfamily)